MFFYLANTNNVCEINFDSVGLSDFDLNMSCHELKEIFPELKKEPNSKLDDKISTYSFVTNQKILNENRLSLIHI